MIRYFTIISFMVCSIQVVLSQKLELVLNNIYPKIFFEGKVMLPYYKQPYYENMSDDVYHFSGTEVLKGLIVFEKEILENKVNDVLNTSIDFSIDSIKKISCRVWVDSDSLNSFSINSLLIKLYNNDNLIYNESSDLVILLNKELINFEVDFFINNDGLVNDIIGTWLLIFTPPPHLAI